MGFWKQDSRSVFLERKQVRILTDPKYENITDSYLQALNC